MQRRRQGHFVVEEVIERSYDAARGDSDQCHLFVNTDHITTISWQTQLNNLHNVVECAANAHVFLNVFDTNSECRTKRGWSKSRILLTSH